MSDDNPFDFSEIDGVVTIGSGAYVRNSMALGEILRAEIVRRARVVAGQEQHVERLRRLLVEHRHRERDTVDDDAVEQRREEQRRRHPIFDGRGAFADVRRQRDFFGRRGVHGVRIADSG